MKLFLWNHMSPGDIAVLTSTIRDLKKSHPEIKVNVETSAMELWENNPYLDKSITKQNANLSFKAEYPLIHKSNNGAYHFMHGYRKFLEEMLNIKIESGYFGVDIHFSKEEYESEKWAESLVGSKNYWLINAGYKSDFTNKMWAFDRYQEVVNRTRDKITWVQVGSLKHDHQKLENVVDLRGKTSHRSLLKLVLNSSGVLTANSYLMHLSTIPMKDGRRRPCVVIGGGREPLVWYQYTGHQCLNTCSMLSCCAKGGCWQSRVEKLDDGNIARNSRLCKFPVILKSGQKIPLCMDMITSDMVVFTIENYLKYK